MLTMKEAAEYVAKRLGRKSFPQATLRSWVFLGKLKVEKVGGKNYVHAKDLEIFLPKKGNHNL